MGCTSCFQVKSRREKTSIEDKKFNSSQIQNFDNLTDAANSQFKTPLHGEKKIPNNKVENDKDCDKTSIGESQNKIIMNNAEQTNKKNTNEKKKNIYDSRYKKEEKFKENNIQINQLNNAYEIQKLLNDENELVQSNNGTLVIGSKTNIFGINKYKYYYSKSNNYINNFKGKNSTNQNANEGLHVINE